MALPPVTSHHVETLWVKFDPAVWAVARDPRLDRLVCRKLSSLHAADTLRPVAHHHTREPLAYSDDDDDGPPSPRRVVPRQSGGNQKLHLGLDQYNIPIRRRALSDNIGPVDYKRRGGSRPPRTTAGAKGSTTTPKRRARQTSQPALVLHARATPVGVFEWPAEEHTAWQREGTEFLRKFGLDVYDVNVMDDKYLMYLLTDRLMTRSQMSPHWSTFPLFGEKVAGNIKYNEVLQNFQSIEGRPVARDLDNAIELVPEANEPDSTLKQQYVRRTLRRLARQDRYVHHLSYRKYRVDEKSWGRLDKQRFPTDNLVRHYVRSKFTFAFCGQFRAITEDADGQIVHRSTLNHNGKDLGLLEKKNEENLSTECFIVHTDYELFDFKIYIYATPNNVPKNIFETEPLRLSLEDKYSATFAQIGTRNVTSTALCRVALPGQKFADGHELKDDDATTLGEQLVEMYGLLLCFYRLQRIPFHVYKCTEKEYKKVGVNV